MWNWSFIWMERTREARQGEMTTGRRRAGKTINYRPAGVSYRSTPTLGILPFSGRWVWSRPVVYSVAQAGRAMTFLPPLPKRQNCRYELSCPDFCLFFCFVVENDGFCISILYYLCLDFDFLVAFISVNLWEETIREIDVLHTMKMEVCTKTRMGALHFVTVAKGIQSGMAVISELSLRQDCAPQPAVHQGNS